MKTIFLKTLKKHRKGLVIWVLVMILTAFYAYMETPMVMENMDSIMSAMEAIPRIVVIMFGMNGPSIGTPIGYYMIMYYWYCLMVYPHAAFVGASFISTEERDRTSEFLFAKPYRRSTVITAKLLAGLVNILVMGLFTWLTTMVLLIPAMGNAPIHSAVTLTAVGMFFTQVVFMALGFLCSALLKSYKAALGASLLLVFGTYAIGVVIDYMGNLNALDFLSPFRYFAATEVVESGLGVMGLLLTVVITAVSLFVTYVRYQKRDLRV